MARDKWSGVVVSMQSALAAATTITGISQADPASVTSAAHGYANGTYILLRAQGMAQVDGRVMRVASAAAGDYDLEGIDSSGFDEFSSGSAEAITFGTSITTITGVSNSGGGAQLEDDTTIHDLVKQESPGLAAATSYTFESFWDPSNTGLAAMKVASDANQERAFSLSWPSGSRMVFNGFVSASLAPAGTAQSKVTTSLTITVKGTPTYFAS